MEQLAADLVGDLGAGGLTLGIAESLTGGALTAALVAVPGASSVVRLGVVAYATDLKAEVLGVDRDLLAASGPVQAAVAVQMARGVARLSGSSVGVATTGVAGPGPSDGHPAGTFLVAVVSPAGEAVRRWVVGGTRPIIRQAAVDAALTLARAACDDVRHAGRREQEFSGRR